MIFLTGATGFIGNALSHHLNQKGHAVKVAVRRPANTLPTAIRQVSVGDIHPDTDWTQALDNVDSVIHLAARVHIMSDIAADPLAEFRLVNTAGTLKLARQAAAAGVRRFIFISSIGVNGNQTSTNPFSAEMSQLLLNHTLFLSMKLKLVCGDLLKKQEWNLLSSVLL